MTEQAQTSLLPERHPTKDFFTADIFDNLPVKDDIASMEHPVFSLSTKPDQRVLEYKNGDVTVSIKPNIDGLPTIHDKDVLLYCSSLLMDKINKGEIPPRTLRISAHDFLVTTNRMTNGGAYALLKKSLDRLKGVTIKTNIKTNKREITNAFGLIESYEIIESSRVKDRMVRLEITLSEWFYNSILGREVLTINPIYFRLRGAIERRIYEIARKHCGRSPEWQIGLEKLREKTGSTSSMPKFRFKIKSIAKADHLPDYTMSLNENDVVTFKRRASAPLLEIDDLPLIREETIRKGAKIVAEAGTGWDYQELRSQFTQQLMGGFKPEKPEGAFINFIKKKVQHPPN